MRRPGRASLCVRAVTYDPDNILGPAQEGHISRRMLQKQMQQDAQLRATVQQAKDESRRQVIARRASRTPPNDHIGLIEYLLNSTAEDMEYEVARCRPQLSVEFFRTLDSIIGQERFGAKPDEEKLAELETLRQYLQEATAAVDAAVAQTASAADRMRKLLTSPDKKSMILEMASNNEIDQPLIDLLQQNITAARSVGQEEPAKFMEKVMVAAAKYVVRPTSLQDNGAAPTIDIEISKTTPAPSSPSPLLL